VAKALAGEMVVADLDNKLGLERLPFAGAFGGPAARPARRVAGEAGRRDRLRVSAGLSSRLIVEVNPT